MRFRVVAAAIKGTAAVVVYICSTYTILTACTATNTINKGDSTQDDTEKFKGISAKRREAGRE